MSLRKSVSRNGRLPSALRDTRRAEILAAALSEIGEHGFEGTTMARVAARAGASKETLYAWFGDKQGLVQALIETNADDALEDVSALLADAPRDADTMRTTLTTLGSSLLQLLTSPASVALNRAAMTSRELATVLAEAGRTRTGTLVADYLERACAAGLTQEPDGSEAFRLFYGLLVRDTQIAVLLGATAPQPSACDAQAERATTQWLQLVGGSAR